MRRTRYARSAELRIAYELRGTLRRWRPWLVLIQGMGFDRRGWQPVLPNLQRHFRLVLIDNRGFGGSDRGAGPFGVADMARDVLAVLDDAGINRAHVLGASLGGMVAQELASTHPERVDGLVLACTAPGWPFAYPMPMATVRRLITASGLSAEEKRRRLTENALSPRTVQHHPELVGRLLQLQHDRQPAVGEPADDRTLQAQAAAGARYAPRLRQAPIRARTLVLQGGADTVVHPRNGRLLADRIPGARLVTFPDLGHLLWWEDPDGFAAQVTAFLLPYRAKLQPSQYASTRGWRRPRRPISSTSGTRPAEMRNQTCRPASSTGRNPDRPGGGAVAACI